MTATAPKITLEDNGDLMLHTEAGPQKVRAARSFPWSEPDLFIALRDDEGHEKLLIEDLRQLPCASRGAIEAWLQRHTFIPRVCRVIEVKPGNDAIRWHVDTDRGERKFHMREREDMRHLSDGRHLLKDKDGVVYELPPMDDLDKHSRDQLALLL